MPEIKDAGHRRRHSLAGSFSQIPFVLYFTPRPQLSKGMIVRGTGRSKSCSKDGKHRQSSIGSSSSGSSSDLSWHMVSMCDEGESQVMIAPQDDSVQAGGRRNGHGPGFHGNNVLKKRRRASQSSSLESGSSSLLIPTSLEAMSASRPRFAHPASYAGAQTRAQTRSQIPSHPPVAMTQSLFSTTSVSTRSLAAKQDSLWLNRKATPPSPSNKKPFPTLPPPPKIFEKTSSSSSTLAASFEDSVSSSSTTTLTRFPSHYDFTSSSFPTSVEDRGRPTNCVPSISASSSSSSSFSCSEGAQHQPIHSNHKRSASIATSMSMYSQMSYPRHLKLPWDPIDGESESGDVEDWLVVKDRDVHSVSGFGFCLDGGQEAKELVESGSGKKSMRGTTRLGRANSRSRRDARSPHLSQSNSRCTSPSPYLEVPTPSHTARHRRPRKGSQRHRRKRSTDTAFTNSTFATFSSVTTASTATSTWRREIAEVKEDMKSFLDMSVGALVGDEGKGEGKEESVWFELEVPSDSERSLTPGGGTESLRAKSKVKKSCSNVKATSSAGDGTSQPPSFLQFQSLSDRYSRVLPSPSPVPTLSYVVFEDEEEERRARYPPHPATMFSGDSTSTSADHQVSAIITTPNSSSCSDQHDLNNLQLDYDYNFAVDVLVHVPESLVDPSFRSAPHPIGIAAEKGHTRRASISASVRLKLAAKDVNALVHGGTKAAFVDMRHSGAKKVGKRPKLTRTKWSFGGSQGSKAGPGSTQNGVVRSVPLSLDRQTEGEDYRRKEKKSLVVQVTNFFSRV
ncbi:hypothetical protein D9613_006512 [Agrocybe pediades]|uniref:Uncharacterized protein n=1 Tax=Agrocybe pediades TaxID=84607 RepID=A0A8H4VJU3_9AGAR|nr:hypothetical protein D9613_006512 [Agrocybe pediades]